MSVNTMILYRLLCAILFSCSQNFMQEVLVIVDIGSQPKSPSKKEIGAFAFTPRKRLINVFESLKFYICSVHKIYKV